jgi:hypothetical protein
MKCRLGELLSIKVPTDRPFIYSILLFTGTFRCTSRSTDIVLGTPDHARLCAADWWACDESVTYRLHTAPTPHLHERHGDAIRCAHRPRENSEAGGIS